MRKSAVGAITHIFSSIVELVTLSLLLNGGAIGSFWSAAHYGRIIVCNPIFIRLKFWPPAWIELFTLEELNMLCELIIDLWLCLKWCRQLLVGGIVWLLMITAKLMLGVFISHHHLWVDIYFSSLVLSDNLDSQSQPIATQSRQSWYMLYCYLSFGVGCSVPLFGDYLGDNTKGCVF
jgi:hypothetical protein